MPNDKKTVHQSQPETKNVEESLWTSSFVNVSDALKALNSSEQVLAAILESKAVATKTAEAQAKLKERLKPFNTYNFTSAKALKPVF